MLSRLVPLFLTLQLSVLRVFLNSDAMPLGVPSQHKTQFLHFGALGSTVAVGFVLYFALVNPIQIILNKILKI